MRAVSILTVLAIGASCAASPQAIDRPPQHFASLFPEDPFVKRVDGTMCSVDSTFVAFGAPYPNARSITDDDGSFFGPGVSDVVAMDGVLWNWGANDHGQLGCARSPRGACIST